MVLGGDEMGRSQQGNNNPYCQDNEISWFNWDLTEENKALLEFTRYIIEFRRQNRVFRQDNWLSNSAVSWFHPHGSEISGEEWQNRASAFGVFLSGEEVSGEVKDDDFFLCFNPHDDMVRFTLPDGLNQGEWKVVIDTAEVSFGKENPLFPGSQAMEVEGRSLVVLLFKNS